MSDKEPITSFERGILDAVADELGGRGETGRPFHLRAIAKRAVTPSDAAGAPIWRPIETVPKDGTEVALLFASEVEVLGQTCPRVRAASWRVDWTIPYRRDNPPTHWSPLPIAPNAAPVAPAAVAPSEREARAMRLLEIAEPILEGAAVGKRVTLAAGDLLRQVRVFLPANAAPTPTVAADAAAPSESRSPSWHDLFDGSNAELTESARPDERMSDAVCDVLAERARQVSEEGCTAEHDDTHTEGALALAAACYAMAASGYVFVKIPPMWPWAPSWWKPSFGRQDLVKAGALSPFAELERIDRARGAA